MTSPRSGSLLAWPTRSCRRSGDVHTAVNSYLFTSSVAVVLVDAGTGDQPWCALVRGQDHDEVDKALARHDLRHGWQAGELVRMVVPQPRIEATIRSSLPGFLTGSPAALMPVSPPSGAPPSLRPLRGHVWNPGQTADHLASRSTARHQRRG
jgi:hypothetical protein